MRCALMSRATSVAVLADKTLVSPLFFSPTQSSSLSTSSCLHRCVSAQCSLYHSSGLLVPTRIVNFDLRKYEMEKRRLRELEKAGIDPANEDDAPWIAPEEQQRLDEEDEQRRAEMEAQRQAFLKKRAEEEAVKRQRFKEFRARQIAMSRQRKETAAEKKEEARQHRQKTSRVEGLEGDSLEDNAGVAAGDPGVEQAPEGSRT